MVAQREKILPREKSFITAEDKETCGPRMSPCAVFRTIHQGWVLHKRTDQVAPPSPLLTLWHRVVRTLLSQVVSSRARWKKTNWYLRTKTSFGTVWGNYDCILDSEFAVSKQIFNTVYCALTRDAVCLAVRSVISFVAFRRSRLFWEKICQCTPKLMTLNAANKQTDVFTDMWTLDEDSGDRWRAVTKQTWNCLLVIRSLEAYVKVKTLPLSLLCPCCVCLCVCVTESSCPLPLA